MDTDIYHEAESDETLSSAMLLAAKEHKKRKD